jgi:small conductance mechanosensitive channel
MDSPVSQSISRNLHETVGQLGDWLDVHGINIVIILIVAWLLRRFGAKIVSQVLTHTVRSDLYPTKSDRLKRIKTLDSLAGAVIRFGVYIFAGILIIGEINPGYTTALFASAGLVTVAVGFGAKDLISDFVRGIFVITENQYRVGDVIDIAGVSGTVEAVTIRTTILRDIDGNVHHVPNGAIVVTTNKTIGFSKLNELIALSTDTDLELAEHIINHIGDELAADPKYHKKIQEPPRLVSFNGYGQGGMLVRISGTTTANDKFAVRSEFYRRLYKALNQQGIKLAAAAPIAGPTATLLTDNKTTAAKR